MGALAALLLLLAAASTPSPPRPASPVVLQILPPRSNASALRRSRRRRLGAGSSAPMVGELEGNTEPLGYFYTRLRVGTPGQDFTVIVDTGSALLAVPCSGCTTCGRHTSTPFDASSSSSFKKSDCHKHGPCACDHGECTYRERFVEGSSIAGKLSVERLGMVPGGGGEPTAFVNALFGCQTQESGYFKTQDADGILGLGQGQFPTILDVLSTEGPLSGQGTSPLPDTMSFCISRRGGEVALGVPPPTMAASEADALAGNGVHYAAPFAALTALRAHNKHYIVGMKNLMVADTDLGVDQSVFNSGQGVLLDSGTSLIYLPRAAYRRFSTVFVRECKHMGLALPKKELVEGADCWPIAQLEARDGGDTVQATAEGATDGSGYAMFPDLLLQFASKGNGVEADATGSASRSSRLRVKPTQYMFVHPSEEHPTHYCSGVLDNGATGVVLVRSFAWVL